MIRFECTCGKTLKAPPKLAGKVSACPACGRAATVPAATSESTRKHSERQREATAYGTSPTANSAIPARENAPSESSPALVSPESIAPDLIEPESNARLPQRTGRHIYGIKPSLAPTWVPSVPPTVGAGCDSPARFQKQPFESGCDPLLGVSFIACLAGIQAVLTAVGVGLYPQVLSEMAWGARMLNGLVFASAWVAAIGISLGWGFHFVDSMLYYGVGGYTRQPQPPTFDLGEAATSLVRWTLCLALGPAVLFYGAFRYWLYSGDMTPLDVLILAELIVVAVTYGMLGLLALSKRRDLAWPPPAEVFKSCRRLGWRAVVAGMGLTLMLLAHFAVGISGVLLLREAGLPGLFVLWLCWFSLWQCSALGLRTLGFWHHRCRKIATVPVVTAIAPGQAGVAM